MNVSRAQSSVCGDNRQAINISSCDFYFCFFLRLGLLLSFGWEERQWQYLLLLICKQFVSCLVMSDSLQPHRWRPTRPLHPWDSPGKNTGEGCHFLLQKKLQKERKGSRSVVSNSLRSHGLQPTRLLHPWDLPGKSTGVGCHHLLRDSTIAQTNLFASGNQRHCVHFQHHSLHAFCVDTNRDPRPRVCAVLDWDSILYYVSHCYNRKFFASDHHQIRTQPP